MTDVPERLQIRNRKLPTTGVEEEKRGEERYRESKWITGMLERNGLMMSFRNEDAVIQSVGHVLRCLKEEHLGKKKRTGKNEEAVSGEKLSCCRSMYRSLCFLFCFSE